MDSKANPTLALCYAWNPESIVLLEIVADQILLDQ